MHLADVTAARISVSFGLKIWHDCEVVIANENFNVISGHVG